MMPRGSRALSAALASLALAACSAPNDRLQTAIPAVVPAASGGYAMTHGSGAVRVDWGRELRDRAQFVGPARLPWTIVHVLVRQRDAAGLRRYALEANTPGTPEYRHFLTPAEIGRRFGADPRDYREAAKYFVENGLVVGGWPQRELLTVSGPLAHLENAFGTTFGTYRLGDETFLAPTGTPHFRRPIAVVAADLAHLPPHVPRRSLDIVNGDVLGYSPQQLGRGFDYTGAWSKGFTGAGITIGVIATEGMDPADMQFLATMYGAPHATLTQVDASPQPPTSENGHTGSGATDPYPAGLAPAPPITAPCKQSPYPDYQTCNPEDGGEAQIDSQLPSVLAPGATVLFYLAYNPSECYDPKTGTFFTPVKNNPITCAKGQHVYQQLGSPLLWDDELQQAIADDRADAISESIGVGEWQEPNYYLNKQGTGVGQIEYASLAAEGIAVFDASGDTGPWECWGYGNFTPDRKCQNYPASDVDVTAVGGLNVPLGATGQLVGELTAWGFETLQGGNGTFDNNTGSGGGYSDFFAIPPWQKGIVPFGASASPSMRMLPDVSLQADGDTGPTIVLNSAFAGDLDVGAAEGTSAAAPEMTAMWALVLQACKATPACATATGPYAYRLGNAAPILYGIFAEHAPGVFSDVSYGNTNALPPHVSSGTTYLTGYTAGPGYDLVTGIGAPYAGHLIHAITGLTVP
ncbi:MAG TPA: protease pro-enzyme activation domain-containing protein [Candidatus Acidoferrales bacterium]|nr:protease pro-enzyme activation domain-containing protein [Candidatus Acidoferrales bacterium]